MSFCGRRAVETPQIDDFRPGSTSKQPEVWAPQARLGHTGFSSKGGFRGRVAARVHPITSGYPRGVTPTSYQHNHENLFFRDPEIIDFGGLDGPGGPRKHSKRRGASRPAFWSCFWGPRGCPDPKINDCQENVFSLLY